MTQIRKKSSVLLVVWPYPNGVQEVVLELKIRYGDLDTTIQEGVKQTWQYIDTCGIQEGHLLIFDRNPSRSWEEKIFCRQETYQGRTITIWGM